MLLRSAGACSRTPSLASAENGKPAWTLRKVCESLSLELPQALTLHADEPLSGIFSSSMTARPGCLYVVRGSSDKVRADALRAWEEKGAVAFLSPRVMTDASGRELPSIPCAKPTAAVISLMGEERARMNARVLALTGSVGKTSTKEMIRLVAGCAGKTEWSRANGNGFSQVLATVQRVQPDTSYCIQEVGMGKPGSVGRAAKVLRPDYFVVTNIGLNHIEYYGGKQENILAEKLKLDVYAAPDAIGFVNWDDPLLRGAKYRHRIVTFGIENDEADFSACDLAERGGGVAFVVEERSTGEKVPVNLDVPGMHNVYNALAAFAFGREAGVPTADIVSAIGEFRPRGVRQNLVELGGQRVYLDCYNASEVAIESAASTLEGIDVPVGGKRIFVVGDIDDKLGGVTEEVHRRVGRSLAERGGLDLLVFFGDHMRWAAEEAQAAGKLVLATSDREELEKFVRDNLRPGDLLGFKGGQQMRLALTVDDLFGTDFFLLDGDMTAKVARPVVEIDGIRYRVLDGYGAELVRFRGLRFTRAGRGVAVRALRSKLGFGLRPAACVDGAVLRCVAAEAFLGSKLTSIALPEGVRSIGSRSFARCARLSRVKLPSSLRCIGEGAFAGCTALRRLAVPEGVTTIARRAFAGCSRLSVMTVPDSVKTIEGTAFEQCDNLVVRCSRGSYARSFCETHGISAQLL